MASRATGSGQRAGGRKRRAGVGGTDEKDGDENPDSDLTPLGVVSGKPKRSTKSSVVAVSVDQSTPLALVSLEGRGMPPPLHGPPPPFSASLLSCYGLFSPHCLHTLENFFAMFLRYGRQEIVDVLVGLSNGMMRAVETHTAVKNDMRLVNGRAEELFEAKQSLDLACGELSAEVEQLKVCLCRIFLVSFPIELVSFFSGGGEVAGARETFSPGAAGRN